MHAVAESTDDGRVSAAIAAWQAAIGSEHVITDEAQRVSAGTTTFATIARVPAIIRPGTPVEVQRCVRIANDHRVPIYPVSRGRNWGYGSRVPARDGCVLMELSRLNRILEYSETLGYVRVEPGVSYRQLHEFLRARGSKLMLSVTGSTPEASVIGNTVERGVGSGPYADHAAHISSLDVVVPTGERITTGFGRFGGAPADHLYPSGVGPSLDGLFLQSNFGIVTAMTVWLAPLPAYPQVCRFNLRDTVRLEGVIDAVRQLKLTGVLSSPVTIHNDIRLLAWMTQYPWADCGDTTPLRRSLLARFRQITPYSTWNGAVAVQSTTAERARLDREDVAAALAPLVDSLAFVTEAGLAVIKSPSETQSRLMRELWGRREGEQPPSDTGLLFGEPTEHNVVLTYWRKRLALPEAMDPDRDGCGFIWLDVIAPLTGWDVTAAFAIMEEEIASAGFEPMLSCIAHTPRAAYLVAPLAYDRGIVGEDGRARTCITRTRHRLMAAGYFPPRLDVGSMDALTDGDAAYSGLLHRLKQTLDPYGILAPGRYGIG